MMSSPPRASTDPTDLEKTAELPSLAGGGLAVESAQRDLGTTDTWIAPQPSELRPLETRIAAEAARAASLETELERARAERTAALQRVDALERDLGETRRALEAAQAQVGELSRRLCAPAPQARSPDPSLEAKLAQRDGALEVAERRLAELQEQLCNHLEALHTVEGRRTVLDTLLRGLESEVSQRDSQVSRLEAQIRARDSMLDSLRRTSPRERAASVTSREAGPVSRQLVRIDAGEEVVHPLGRKTRIGRTPDNDVRVGAKFVSRHHALVLVGPGETIIEDLNSTNGVLVNGQRIARHSLKDGDTIKLGEARFRFVVRGIV
jgi:septal ring factor EnvC (AmiA/AmiB activator)